MNSHAAADNAAQAADRRHSLRIAFAITLVIGIALSAVVHWQMTRILERMAEVRSVSIANIMRNALWPEFERTLGDMRGHSAMELHTLAVRKGLHREVAVLMARSDVVKVKLYNLDGVTVYSSDPEQIGENKQGNAGFIAAAAGRTASQLTHRDSIDAFEERMEDRDVLSTYLPVVAEKKVIAVFEIYLDVTESVRDLSVVFWITAALFAVLLGMQLVALANLFRAPPKASRTKPGA